jgi:hypothetical protein
MTLKKRVTALVKTVVSRAASRPVPGQLELVTAYPVGCGIADGRPAGVYFNVDGTCADVIFEGPEPDPTIMGPLRARLGPHGMTIVSHPS